MLSERMEKALNQQVNAELYSSYLYLSMASYLGSLNLDGFVNWMKVQALEELYHALKLYNFIEQRGGRPRMEAIEKPATEWDSPVQVFEAVLEHEQNRSRRRRPPTACSRNSSWSTSGAGCSCWTVKWRRARWPYPPT